MKKTMMTISAILGLVVCMSGQAMAAGSMQHASQALAHSGQAVGESVVAGAQLTSAAVAVPLIAVGSVGKVSGDIGHGLLKASEGEIGDPLPVTDETVTAGPTPTQAVYPNR